MWGRSHFLCPVLLLRRWQWGCRRPFHGCDPERIACAGLCLRELLSESQGGECHDRGTGGRRDSGKEGRACAPEVPASDGIADGETRPSGFVAHQAPLGWVIVPPSKEIRRVYNVFK